MISGVPWLLRAFWFFFGTILGSFLNVCIYRIPRDQSIVRPRSRCPACHHPIAWYDNVPLVSYVALRARCRHCRARIHWRYPLVELLTGLLSVAVLARFGVTVHGLSYVVFVWALIVVSFIDLEHRIIPFTISVGGLLLWLLMSLFAPQLHGTSSGLVGLGRSIFGALIGCGLLYLTGSIGSFVFKKEAMGLGDVDLLAMAGALLGWKLVTLAFFLAPLLAVVPGLIVLYRKHDHEIPYGPFLALGLILSIFFGGRLIQATGIEETMRMFWSYYVGS